MKPDGPVPLSLGNSRLAVAAKRFARASDALLVAGRRLAGLGPRPSVLFEVYNPFGFDAQEPVAKLLAARGRVDVHISGAVERGIAPSRIAALSGAGIHFHRVAAVRHRRFDAVIVTDSPLIRSWRSPRYVFLHHGSGFANRPFPYAFEMLQSGDVDFLLSLHPTEMRDAEAYFGDRMRRHIRVVGQPKLDRLVHATQPFRAWLESHGLDPGRRTILFLSHWESTSLMHTWGSEVLALLRARTEFNVLVTGHFHLWDHPARSGGVDWRARLAWINDQPHMRLFPQPENLAELMIAADLAISDNTSGTLEYALLRRPIVLFRHPDFTFSDPRLDELLHRTARVFTHVDEFPAALEQALQPGEGNGAARRDLIEYSFSFVGESSLRAATAIEQVAVFGVLSDAAAEVHQEPPGPRR